MSFLGEQMYDLLSLYNKLENCDRERLNQMTVFMPGFDSVADGNEEYILLTDLSGGPGEIHRFIQLPNDAATIAELNQIFEK
jgi:hypothetical protein